MLICILIAEHLVTAERARTLARGGVYVQSGVETGATCIFHYARHLGSKLVSLLINVRLTTAPVISSWHQGLS